MREFECKTSRQRQQEKMKAKFETSLLMAIYRVTFLRSFVKWVMRKITGMCELQRIIRKHKMAERTVKIERCLLLSKNEKLQNAAEDGMSEETHIHSLVMEIMKIKSIVPETDPPFEDALSVCLTQIRTYKYLCNEVELLRKEAYNCENEAHEQTLKKLWKLLKPDEEMGDRVSKKWCDLGFQGCDPKTDFRGMGMLGLQCMVHFAENHNQKARQVLQRSHHPVQGYSYAIVSINMTSLTYELLQTSQLRSHFFNEVQGRPIVSDFLDAFCSVFSQFDKFWFESEPENVMAFSRIRAEFLLQLSIHLAPPNYGSLEMA